MARFSGTYAQSDTDLTITTELMTAAACIGPAGEQDTSVIAALDKVQTAGVAADQLVLKDAQGAHESPVILVMTGLGLAGRVGVGLLP